MVCDTGNHRIQRSDDDGATWTTIGARGSAPGQFVRPSGVACNAAGTVIWVADTGNSRIQRSRDGGVTWEVLARAGRRVGQVRGPEGLGYDETGDPPLVNDTLFVADTRNNRIQCAIRASSDNPEWAVFDGATAGTRVGKMKKPAAVAVAPNGDIFVADCGNNRIQVDRLGGWEIFAGARAGRTEGRVRLPTAVHVSENGDVFVADTGNHRIQVNRGQSAESWQVLMSRGSEVGQVMSPRGLAMTEAGHLFIGDTGNNRIQRLPAGGGSFEVVGPPGAGAGQFAGPTRLR